MYYRKQSLILFITFYFLFKLAKKKERMDESQYFINVEDNEEKEDNKTADARQPTKAPLNLALSSIWTSIGAFLLVILALFSRKAADIKEDKVYGDNKKNIDNIKRMLSDQKSSLDKERIAILNLEETIKSLADQTRKCKDPIKVKRLKEEGVNNIRIKYLKESSLMNTRNQIQALEETISQYEQFSSNMNTHKQMRPLIKSIKTILPGKRAIQQIKKERTELAEATRNLNAELNELNRSILIAGDEHKEEQQDDQIDIDLVTGREFDAYVEAIEETEAAELKEEMPTAPSHHVHVSLPYENAHTPRMHNHQKDKPLISEFNTMD